MNYYNPNCYMNYPYVTAPSSASGLNQYIQPQIPPQAQLSQLQGQVPALNGKIVDSEDVVKATEVPIGGYGIFPKSDLSEIYIKSWNNNGTTSVITFKPVIPENKPEPADVKIPKLSEDILTQIQALGAKIDSVLTTQAINKEATKNVY